MLPGSIMYCSSWNPKQSFQIRQSNIINTILYELKVKESCLPSWQQECFDCGLWLTKPYWKEQFYSQDFGFCVKFWWRNIYYENYSILYNVLQPWFSDDNQECLYCVYWIHLWYILRIIIFIAWKKWKPWNCHGGSKRRCQGFV